MQSPPFLRVYREGNHQRSSLRWWIPFRVFVFNFCLWWFCSKHLKSSFFSAPSLWLTKEMSNSHRVFVFPVALGSAFCILFASSTGVSQLRASLSLQDSSFPAILEYSEKNITWMGISAPRDAGESWGMLRLHLPRLLSGFNSPKWTLLATLGAKGVLGLFFGFIYRQQNLWKSE